MNEIVQITSRRMGRRMFSVISLMLEHPSMFSVAYIPLTQLITNHSMTNTYTTRDFVAIPMNTPSPSSEFTLFVITHYPMISLLSLFLLSLVLTNPDNGEFTYSEYPFLSITTFSSSVLLATKKTNLYWIDELSNVCVKDSEVTVFGLPSSDITTLSEHTGISSSLFNIQVSLGPLIPPCSANTWNPCSRRRAFLLPFSWPLPRTSCSSPTVWRIR